MKGNKPCYFFCSHILVMMMTLYVFMQFVGPASGQVSTPCSGSMISTFTPCMNYVTGSSYNTTSSPTTECCNSLGTIISDSIDCACLILTANVPLPTTGIVNRALVISLPSFCNSPGVPVQCKAQPGSPLPAPGPVLFGPPPPPSDISPGGEGPTEAPQGGPGIASQVPATSPSKTSLVEIRTVMSPSNSSPSCTMNYTPHLMVVSFFVMLVLKLY